MLFTSAIEASLQTRGAPVITTLDLHLLTQGVFTEGQWNGQPLQRLPREWDQRRLSAIISRLIARGVLTTDADAGYGTYRALNVEGAGSAEEVACLLDPFCYISYGSALYLHRLVGMRPAPLHISTLTGSQWRARLSARLMELSPNKEGMRPRYPRIGLGEKLRRRTLAVHETQSPAPTVEIGWLRVSSLAATFVDTLTEPGRCGGMDKVLRLWVRHAGAHVPELVAALEGASKIVKVRAGYIFTERLGIETPETSAWQAFAQRGGSRRLDPERPYAPVFSERWMLSLNAKG